jgi:cellulose 1,4-beta-cellobiosidase
MGLEVLYLCATTTTPSQEIKPHFQIVNNGTAAVDLSTLTIRYFWTKDGTPTTDLHFDCDYAMVSCSNVTSAFNTWTGTNADEYTEVGFKAGTGTLAPGANSGEIQARFHSTDYQYMLNQANDYSFDPTKTTFTPWTNVTLYQNGTLVWGTEP